MENHMRQTSVQEVLQRTYIIDNERDSVDIVNKILKLGRPIGVDMEGHHSDPVGLVQIRSSDGAIYLFRTGVDSRILKEGKLKVLLEDPDVQKVFHAGVGDAIVIYKSGVKMVNLYDTALAQKVIEFQNFGRSIHRSRGQLFSFNKMCEHYKVTVNPMKMDMKKSNLLWMRDDVYKQPRLPDEMVAYAAYDVEPLLDLQRVTSSLIEEDYLPIFRDLCEEDVIRNVDPPLLKHKKADLIEHENNTVFLHNLKSKLGGKKVNKAEVYELLSLHEGMKKVLCSTSSAHVILPSRQSALLLYQSLTEKDIKLGNLTKQLKEKFGHKAKAELVNEAVSSEIMSANIETAQALNRMKSENYIIDNKTINKLSEILLKTKIPVILSFVLRGEELSLELFTGRHPILKFKVSQDTIENGLGEILASRNIVKIVPRLDTNVVQQALRIAASFGFKPISFFDLNAACNAIDYAVMGQSLFAAPSLPIKTLSSRFGIETPTSMDDYLYTYLHLVNHLLPQSILDFLSTKTSLEVDLASNISPTKPKEDRRKLRIKYEGQCVHVLIKNTGFVEEIQATGICASKILESILTYILKKHNLTHSRIDVFEIGQIISGSSGVAGIVQLPYPDDIAKFCNIINEFDSKNVHDRSRFARAIIQNFDSSKHKKGVQAYLEKWGITMAASKINSKEHTRVDPKLIRNASLHELDFINYSNLQELDNLRFFEVLNEYKI